MLVCLGLVIGLLTPGTLQAGPVEDPARSSLLHQGDPAPQDGVFLPLPALQRLIEALRDKESLQAELAAMGEQIDALEAQRAASAQEIQALRQALEATKLALAKAEWIDQNWQRIVDRYEAEVTRLDKRVEVMEKQRTLLMLLGPFALLVGMFLH